MRYFKHPALYVALLAFSATLGQVVGIFKGGKTSKCLWTAPTLNEDGSELTDLAGYELALFNQGAVVDADSPLYMENIADKDTVEFSLVTLLKNSNLENSGIYTVSIRAYDTYGNRSLWADSITVDVKVVGPGKVTGFTVVK